jgi:hypothetical protein
MAKISLNTDQLNAIQSKVVELVNPTDITLVELEENFEDNEIILTVAGKQSFNVTIDGFVDDGEV